MHVDVYCKLWRVRHIYIMPLICTYMGLARLSILKESCTGWWVHLWWRSSPRKLLRLLCSPQNLHFLLNHRCSGSLPGLRSYLDQYQKIEPCREAFPGHFLAYIEPSYAITNITALIIHEISALYLQWSLNQVWKRELSQAVLRKSPIAETGLVLYKVNWDCHY